jgi:hypothetical protein
MGGRERWRRERNTWREREGGRDIYLYIERGIGGINKGG